MDRNNLIQLSDLNDPLSIARRMPDCSNPPKWIIPSTSNVDIKRFLCHKLLVFDASRSQEEVWAKVYTLTGNGEAVFLMLEEEWVQRFDLPEGRILYQIIQKHKKESEQTDVSKYYNA